MSFPTPNPAPVSLSTYDVHAFNGRTRLTAASHLPPGMLAVNNNKRSTICSLIKEERKRLITIKQVINSSTPTTPRLRSSTTSPASSTMDHGEASHGDHHRPGPPPSNSPSPLPHRIHPLPMKLTVSKINTTRYRPQVHRCHTHQMYNDHADFIDDNHDDIISIFGEEVLHNID